MYHLNDKLARSTIETISKSIIYPSVPEKLTFVILPTAFDIAVFRLLQMFVFSTQVLGEGQSHKLNTYISSD